MDDFFKNNPNLFGNNQNNNNNNNNFYRNHNNQGKNKGITPNNYNRNQNQNLINNRFMKNNQSGNNQNKKSHPINFIIGKFGKKTVISQDLNTFLKSIKQAEWTTNTSYLMAKDIKVETSFNKLNNNELDNNIPKYSNTINKLYLHLNDININDFNNYVNEIKNRKNKLKEDAKKEKEEFMKSNFPNEGKLDLNTILNRIRNNKKSFISKDQLLYNKISQSMI